jgi:small-conductance mechanosensitive channel
VDPQPPDPYALRRRVLLAGAVALLSFFVLGYVITAIGAPPWLLLPALLLVAVLVLRPMMAPVFAANRLRRRLAYQAFLEQREAERD